MTRSKREIELDDDDWAETDEDGSVWEAAGDGPQDLYSRFIVAAYSARPPEPREVDFDGMTWRRDEDGEWEAKDCCTASAFEDRLFDCIHELERLEEAP